MTAVEYKMLVTAYWVSHVNEINGKESALNICKQLLKQATDKLTKARSENSPDIKDLSNRVVIANYNVKYAEGALQHALDARKACIEEARASNFFKENHFHYHQFRPDVWKLLLNDVKDPPGYLPEINFAKHAPQDPTPRTVEQRRNNVKRLGIMYPELNIVEDARTSEKRRITHNPATAHYEEQQRKKLERAKANKIK